MVAQHDASPCNQCHCGREHESARAKARRRITTAPVTTVTWMEIFQASVTREGAPQADSHNGFERDQFARGIHLYEQPHADDGRDHPDKERHGPLMSDAPTCRSLSRRRRTPMRM